MGCVQSNSDSVIAQASRKSRQLDRERYGYAADDGKEGDWPKKLKAKPRPESPPPQKPEPEQPPYQGPTRRVRVDRSIRQQYEVKCVLHRTERSDAMILKADERFSRKPYALKVLPAATEAGRFRTELDAIRRARHPNIVRCVAHIKSPGCLCLVLELATGGRLSQRLEERGLMSEPTAAGYSAQLLDGLAHLHGVGCAHRNIRLENLLFYHVGPDSRLIIVDFACALLPGAADHDALAPPGSSASETPEGLAGRPCGQPSDIWAVGLVTIAMLTGRRTTAIRSQASLPQSISQPARQFLVACLRPDPDDRPTAVEARRFAWLPQASPKLESTTVAASVSRRSASSGSGSRRAASQSGSSSRCSSSRLGDCQLSDTGTELRSYSDSTCS